MDHQPPALVENATETDRDFRNWVRGKLTALEAGQKHNTEQLRLIGNAMELLLKAQGLDADD